MPVVRIKLVALSAQRNFENMLAAFEDDDRGIGRFAASRQFASELRSMLHGQGGIRKHLTDLVLEERRPVPVVKIKAWHRVLDQIE
jgi:hypothetical protein